MHPELGFAAGELALKHILLGAASNGQAHSGLGGAYALCAPWTMRALTSTGTSSGQFIDR
jgi:hypothetical protein